ncbi:MAG: ABC transporter permease subunit [Flavobacteriales bacterium]|nr:ABC transporter permease subunit [Flavobacteriales bacterium]
MRKSWLIARRDLAAYFDGPMAYILLTVLLGTWGFFTWWYGAWYPDVFVRKQADLNAFFQTAYWTLFAFIPAITMRSLAEERRSGTLDVLLTRPVTDWQVVSGKFLACLVLVLIALGATLPYYAALVFLGDVDHGAVWCGYFGLACMSAAYCAMGILASSLSRNQVESFLVAMLLILFFHVVLLALPGNFTGALGEVLRALGTSAHFEALSRGVIDTRDLLYFGSITLLALVLAEHNLAKRLFTRS